MVPMRDGVRLAFDIYRPARDGDFVAGRFPTIMLHTPYDKTDKRYSEIADFFVPKGYNTVLIDLRDRYRSEGSGVYYHAATPHTGRDGYDICEWIAAQPWSNGRIGTVGSSYAAITQVRTALEAPPHLTAIWPDVVPTNSFQNQCREGGAMQQHMFWALFIHAQDAQDIARRLGQAAGRVERPARPAAALPRDAVAARPDGAAPRADARGLAASTTTRAAPTTSTGARIEHDYTRFWDQHADIPGTFSTGWYDPFPTADTRVLHRDDGAERARRSGSSSARGATSACAATRPSATRSTSARRACGACSATSTSSSRSSTAGLLDDAPPAPADEAPVRIFVMGGGSGRRTAEGKLDHGGRWREEQEWPLARRVETPYYLHGDGSLSTGPAGRGRRAAALHVRSRTPGADPRRPLLLDRRAAGRGGRDGAGLGPVPQPGAAAARPAHARPGRPEGVDPSFFGSEAPFPRLSERPDVLVFQTEPLAEPVEVTGRMTVHLWISSSALDTDFTAKVIDVHPANEDYPEGFDMILNDSVIRCRYREGFDREVLLTPGEVVPVTIALPPTSNLFDVGHRIRVDVSSSNWPRLDVNPNTGEPMGRHTHQVVAHQAVYLDAEHPSHVVLPIIPA